MDPMVSVEMASLTDKQFFLLLAAAISVIQFLYRIWDKQDTKSILDAITKSNKETFKMMSETLDKLNPHLERSRAVYGMVKDLKGMHEIRDDDGRPMWYMPREVISMQRELVQLSNVVATTQKHISTILQRQQTKEESEHERMLQTILNHQDECKNQYVRLSDRIKNGGKS